MATIDISQKLESEKQFIKVSADKEYEVDCSAETMLKAQEMFKKDVDVAVLFKIIDLFLGKEAGKEIRNAKLKVTQVQTIILAIMAQVQEISLEEMESRFRGSE